jgi:hypothetical protein
MQQPCVSTAAFLTHPLLARLRLSNHQPRQWECEATVPDAASYVIVSRPAPTGMPPVPDERWVEMATASRTGVLSCLERARIHVISPFCALLDTEAKTLHHVDLVGEHERRPCLILLYYTSSRLNKHNRQAAAEHMRALCRLCREQYALHVIARGVNVYYTGGGRLESRLMPG